jgi:hypothetical protein
MTETSRRTRTLLGLTGGQWQTILLAVILAGVLLAVSLPPVLDSRAAACFVGTELRTLLPEGCR